MGFKAWAKQYEVSIQDRGTTHGSHIASGDHMVNYGCAFLDVFQRFARLEWNASTTDPCTGRWEPGMFIRWRPWAARCPQTCGCNAANASSELRAVCPSSCFAG